MTYWLHPTDPSPEDLPLTDLTDPPIEEEEVNLPVGIEAEDPKLEDDLEEEALLEDDDDKEIEDDEVI